MIAKEPEDTMITAKLHNALNTFFFKQPFPTLSNPQRWLKSNFSL